MTLFYALLGWRSYADRERSMADLRPFVASQRLYERMLRPAAPPEIDIAMPFRALCEDVPGARVAYLAALGPFAPLVGPPRSAGRPARSPSKRSTRWRVASARRQVICVPLAGEALRRRGMGGAAVERARADRRAAVGDKRDGGLYTQEEIEIARATGERLIDTRASAEMARRLMALSASAWPKAR